MLTTTARMFPNNGKLFVISDTKTSRMLAQVEVQTQYKSGDPHRVRISWCLSNFGSVPETELMAKALLEAVEIARREDKEP